VRWLHRGRDAPSPLERAVTAIPIPAGESLYVWMAGEAGALAPLRRWTHDELRLGPNHRSITGYWKRCVSDFEEDDD
jgi:NADPH-dependent ferric siderophore reductase